MFIRVKKKAMNHDVNGNVYMKQYSTRNVEHNCLTTGYIGYQYVNTLFPLIKVKRKLFIGS